MRKLIFAAGFTVLIVIMANLVCYKYLYDRQTEYVSKLLDRQVRIAGSSIDSTSNRFSSDLSQTIFTEDIENFFVDPGQRSGTVDRLKLFFSSYGGLITGIKLYDNNKNEFSLKKDETGYNWLEQNFVLHTQGDIVKRDSLIGSGRFFEYYLPVIRNDVPAGNIVVNIDYGRYFEEILSPFNLSSYQWQSILDETGKIVYSNREGNITYSQTDRIIRGQSAGAAGTVTHSAEWGGKTHGIISSYYWAHFLQRNFGIVFSSPEETFGQYLVRNSVIILLVTIVAILLLVVVFWKYLKSQATEMERLGSSEETLFRMIEEMPVGVVIYNGKREIIKANRIAAEQYSYPDDAAMTGKVFPLPAVTDENNYFSKNLGGNFHPDQFIILKKADGDMILFRNSMPVKFSGEDARMEMLLDVTNLESARMHEARASSAKSDFLARISYEIRTPLSGIIGMADLLAKQHLSKEASDILNLQRRSAETLMTIMNDILDFSKIESGKMTIDEIPLSLREEIVYCYDMARKNIDESRISFTCNVEENVPDKLIGDPFRIRQVISTFLNHSIENTSEGKITLNCRLAEKADGLVKLAFELSDTGKTFDKTTLGKLFGEYVSIQSKVYLDDSESGFERILARQFVELMGGSFSVVSPSGLEGGRGTRLSFTISVHANEIPEKELYFENIKDFGTIKTLVITGCQARDEEILGSLHKLGLAITVTTFQKMTVSQIKASQAFPDKRYHLIVILDDKEFNGFDAAREINDNNLSGNYRIIIISTNDQKGNLVRCINMGVDHYLVKPYELSELYDILITSFPVTGGVTVASNNAKPGKDLKILVVEDNKMNQKVIGIMLKSLGYSFDIANDGFAGLIQAKTRRYDVIFMDLLMPEMDGFESARKILEYDSTLLIVAFTADNMPESKYKAELAGIREFIPKPVRIEDLKKLFTKFFYKN